MFPEEKTVFNPNNIVLVILIVVFQVLQNLQFHLSLVLELFLVPDNLECDSLACFMIVALNSLSERTFT